MNELALFYPQGHEAHAERGHPERPARVEAIKDALTNAGVWEEHFFPEPTPLPDSVLHAIHTPEYLERLRAASEQGRRLDMDTYITPQSWGLANNGAAGAAAVANTVWNREAQRGFALTRPPGHHATPDRPMGFCLLNNVALAAEYLLQTQGARRLAIIDIDLHHGNGTQDIFYRRGEVFFCSSHMYAPGFYPGTGRLEETGEGQGANTNLNLPWPPHSGDQAISRAMEEIILPLLERFEPEMLLISAGFDGHWRDPLGQLLFSADCFGQIIARFAAWADKYCEGRIALVLEGGYDIEAGASSALAATHALLGRPWEDPIGPGPIAESDDWKAVLGRGKEIWGI